MSDEIETPPKPRPLQQGEKDRAIARMACLKAAAETVAARPPHSFIAQEVMKVAAQYEEWVYRDLALPPAPPPEFDPGKNLLPGAIQGDDVPRRLGEAMKAIDPTLDWRGLIGQVEGERDASFWMRLANAVEKLSKHAGGVAGPETPEVVEVFAWAFGGQAVQPEYLEPAEAPLAGVAIPEVDESIPFGERRG